MRSLRAASLPYQGLLSMVLAIGLLVSLPVTVRAAELADHAKSLKGVPADVTFYVASLKGREQFEAMVKTNAWKKLISIPALQMGWMQAQTFWQYPTDDRLLEVKQWIEGEEGQEILALAAEMASEEMFLYGGKSVADLLEVFGEANSAINRTQFEALRQLGNPAAIDSEEVMKEFIAKFLQENREKLNVPEIVAGFRIQDVDRASELLALMEDKLQELADDIPLPLDEMLKREKSEGIDLLTLTLTSDLIPWDEIEGEMLDNPEMFELIQEIASDKQIVIAVGVVHDFVVVSIGKSTDHLKNLSEGKSLADTPEMQRLAQHADQRVVGLAYVSRHFLEVANSSERQFRDLAVMAQGLLSMADLDPLRVEAIENDIDELIDDILTYLPKPGAVAAVKFMTDRGYEHYAYNWGEIPKQLDASQPLTLIDHVGEDSLGWFVARGKQSLEGYDQMVSWGKRIFTHIEEIAEAKSPVDDWQEYQEVRQKVMPLLRKINNANRTMLIPGMADGQSALVFEATIADQEWCLFMPAAQNALPLPTLAMVMGVSDKALVKNGLGEYLDVAQQAIDLAHEASPNEVPAFAIPAPTETSSKTGTIYAYELPEAFGASDRLAPNAGLNDSVLVLSVLPELSAKLLDGSRPALDGPVSDFSRPLLSASHFKFAKFLDACQPWIDYGIQIAIEQQSEEAASIVGMVGFVKPQVDQFIEVLKVFDSYTGVTYREDDAWVTHGEIRIIDLED